MFRPCVVSFAPGTGGNFVGNVCQYIIHGSMFKIANNGSCHTGNIVNWGEKSVVINDTPEAILNEINEIKNNLPETDLVVVTHSRNINELSKQFQKTIWISFTPDDIQMLLKQYKLKNNYTIYEHNYNNIKDPLWPEYGKFVAGEVSDFVKEEVNNKIYVEPYVKWQWILPKNIKKNLIFELPYSKILECNHDIIYNLCRFIDPKIKNHQLEYVFDQWQEYKNKQQTIPT